MKKFIVVIGIVIALVALAFVGLKLYTKSFSPQETITYDKSGMDLAVTYSRPYMNDRVIFGELVPYDEVWRTGANEATTFATKTAILINEEPLPAGEYSVFARPGKDEWEIIFNSETGQWGISPIDGQANRKPDQDVLTVTVPSITTTDTFPQFTITFDAMSDDVEMIMMWDQTMVVIPITVVAE